MAKKKGNQVDIYTTLDELLDTRLATLHRMDPALAEKVLFNGYHTRDSDFFEGVDQQAFRKLYNERDADILQCAHLTEAFKLIKKIAENIAEQLDSRPYYSGSKLIVNCYPYNIAPEILTDMKLAIRVKIANLLPVELIHAPCSEITPQRCADEFGALILYDAEEWLNTHMRALEARPIPEVMLLSPMLFHRHKPSPEKLAEIIEESCHPFLATQAMVRPLIQLDLIEVSHFCVIKDEQPTAN
jgi:hypothetical protein